MKRTLHREENWAFPFISYEPENFDGKMPLVIQLHGAGDGIDIVEGIFQHRNAVNTAAAGEGVAAVDHKPIGKFFNFLRRTFVKGNLKVAFEKSATGAYEHTDYGYPGWAAYHDFECKNMVANGWMLGNTPNYNRFMTGARGYGYAPNSIMSAMTWMGYYPTIRSCNQIIDLAGDNEEYAKYRGMAKAYRDYLLTGGSIYDYLIDYNYIDETYYTNFFDFSIFKKSAIRLSLIFQKAKNQPKKSGNSIDT